MSSLFSIKDIRKKAKKAAKQIRKDWKEFKEEAPALLKDSQEFLERHLDADKILRQSMKALIETARLRYPLDPGREWQEGHPLELLLVGYSGTRNTGADVRVEEMIRQMRHLLGDEHLRLSILTLNPEFTRGYFQGVRQIHAPTIFPKFMFDVVHEQHGVIACEGSMFKSKFANALTTFMVGAMGVAAAENKLAIGYGGEAGEMDKEVKDFVKTYCEGTHVIARNKSSLKILEDLRIHAYLGTDTAWTFEPHPESHADELLKEAGISLNRPLVVACPINAFWWPVKGNFKKGLEHKFFGAHHSEHFKSIYFHADSKEVEDKQNAYLDAYYHTLLKLKEDHQAEIVLLGMEALDRRAIEALAKRFPEGEAPAIFVSDEYEHRSLVSILRKAKLLISSRYHAIVCAMPAGVPAIGVTMDERISNLLGDAGLPELALEVDSPRLSLELLEAAKSLFEDGEPVREALQKDLVRQLKLMASMGQTFVELVKKRYPQFPISKELGKNDPVLDYLPPLSEPLKALYQKYS